MRKVLFLWDVKSRGTPATLFYRELKGYNYKTKSGKRHSEGLLDELPEEVWNFVCRSALLVEEEHAKEIANLFKRYDTHLNWKKFVVKEGE